MATNNDPNRPRLSELTLQVLRDTIKPDEMPDGFYRLKNGGVAIDTDATGVSGDVQYEQSEP